MIMAFLHLKRSFTKFLAMYSEIRAFVIKNKLDDKNLSLSFVMFLLCFIITYVTIVNVVLFNPIITKIFEPIGFKLLIYQHGSFTCLYNVYWIFTIQFINFEICHKYYILLKFYDHGLSKYYKFRPSYLLKYKINEVMLKFKVNNNDFKQTIYPLRIIILIMIFSLDIAIIFVVKIFIDSNVDILSITFLMSSLFCVNFYFLVTQILLIYYGGFETKICNNIRSWLNLDKNIILNIN